MRYSRNLRGRVASLRVILTLAASLGAIALFISCDNTVGDTSFGVSGTVRSKTTHEPVVAAWCALGDSCVDCRFEVDSTGAFSAATWGCGTETFYLGAPRYLTYDTIIEGRGCPVIKDLVIELEPIGQ